MTISRRHADIQPGELARVLLMMRGRKSSEPPEKVIAGWEKTFAHYIGKKHAIAVGSGRLAMKIILESFRLEVGNEVVIPAYTLKDLIPIIQSIGLTPVPSDIDPYTFNINANSVSSRLTKQTRVILATHLFGNPCPVKELMDLAETYELKMIEDCAHSAGAQIHGKKTGVFGVASFFSFETIKMISTYGGGMIVTDDDTLAKYAREEVARIESPARILKKVLAAYLERFLFSTSLASIPLFLLASKRGHEFMTSFYRSVQHAPKSDRRYSEGQAALGLEKIRTIEDRIRERRAKAETLKRLLPNAIRVQHVLADADPNYYFFVALLPEEAFSARKYLLARGFDAGIGHEIADNCAAALGHKDCPHVQDILTRAIHLPLHEGIDDHQIEDLGNLLRKRYP